ncbi:hypothetical protein B4U80_04809, partial [Leptotrombidium deliense]
MIAAIVIAVIVSLINCHPAPTILCHGYPIGSQFHYKYSTLMLLNNNDHYGKEPVGFGYNGHLVVENVWQSDNEYFLKIDFESGKFGHFVNRKGEQRKSDANVIENEYSLFAHIDANKETDEIKAFYVNKHDSTTKVNLKKAFVSLLRTKKAKEIPSLVVSKSGQELKKYYYKSNIDESEGDVHSVLVPAIVDEWESKSKLARDHSYITESIGWQNISLSSRLYSTAHSKLHTKYEFNFIKETNSDEKSYSSLSDLKSVVNKIGDDYLMQRAVLNAEKKVCHNCMTLKNLVKEYEDFLHDDKMASIQMAIAYMKIVDRVRTGGPGTSKTDIIELLNECRKQKNRQTLASLLDVLAGAMTEQSIGAALEHLNLPTNEELDLSERFLATLAASYLTLSETGIKSSDSSHEFITRELIKTSMEGKWVSEKLKWTTLITLGTILRSHNHLMNTPESFDDDLNRDVMKHLNSELRSCTDSDCKVSLLYAIGNTGNLKLSLNTLEKYALNLKQKRESVAAIRAIKDCLNYNQSIDNKLTNKLKALVAKVVFDKKHETTSRIIASEIITHHLNDDILVNSLFRGVSDFDNFEMTTMMWTKALKAVKVDAPPSVNNWLAHSTLFNGTSDSYKKAMGGTDTMNHLITVNLFARGLESLAGTTTSTAEETTDSTSAGMSLKIFGVQLRPYIFFTTTGELMGHVWSGTASEPTSAVRDNLLISDHSYSHSLINGFLVEQNIRGVLSLDMTGEVQISLWNRNSHSVVKTRGALLIQGSQSIYTSETSTSVSQMFSFGDQSSIQFVTDIDFYSSPFKMCMQISQPDFIVRHNSRKYESVNSPKADRRIHRRNYVIPAKSFALNRDNNAMCSIMQH